MNHKLLDTIDITGFAPVGYGNDRVYKMTEPFIKSLSLSSVPREQIEYLARPVLHSDGRTVDWEIPFESKRADGSYLVVKWTAATPEERAEALLKLKEFERNLHTYSKEAKRTKEDALFVNFLAGEQSSRKLNAIHFPGKEFVYIVDGKPVITMWGFLKDNNDSDILPFTRLEEVIPKFTGGATFTPPPPPPPLEPAVPPPPPPFAAPPQEPEPAPVEKKRHVCCAGGIFAGHTLCWVIFLILLLLLLIPLLMWLLWKFFGLFAGIFDPLFGVPDVPVPDLNPPAIEAPLDPVPVTPVDEVVPAVPAVDEPVAVVDGSAPAIGLTGGSGAGSIDMGGAGGAGGGAGSSDAGTPPPAPAAGDAGTPPPAPAAGDAGAPAPAPEQAPAAPAAPVAPPDPQMPAQQSVEAARAAERQAAIEAARAAEEQAVNPNAASKPVTPPDPVMPGGLSFSNQDLQNKGVSVLNGDWNTRSPLMDSANGRPLQMSYKFDNGKGEITVTRPNGSKCTAPISAAVQGKDIVIENGGKAVCPDNSTYQLPQVKCTPDANGKVTCTGQNGNQRFPITLYSK